MNYHRHETIKEHRIKIESILAEIGIEQTREEIRSNLQASPKKIPSKFFYNTKGSRLFEEITELPEYYPGRTEKSILKEWAHEIVKNLEEVEIVELGSGDPAKISILLSAIPPEKRKSLIYIPVDVSLAAVEDSARILAERFPEIEIDGLVADFSHQINQIPSRKKRIFCFFGSTIGNQEHREALEMIHELGNSMNPEEELLLGLDRIKDEKILFDAYNDSHGVTAEFNINILNVINNLMETDVDPNDFRHLAFYNRQENRIEMHLEATRDVSFESRHLNDSIHVMQGERIHTENSHKYSMESIEAFAKAGNLKIYRIYSDPGNLFWLVQYKKSNRKNRIFFE